MQINRIVGLHLRIEKNIHQLALRAKNYKIKSFQFFLTQGKKSKYISLNGDDQKNFLQVKDSSFSQCYIHSSYWINPATGNEKSYKTSELLLKKEMNFARALKIKQIVLHPGYAKDHISSQKDPDNKISGIRSVSKMLNSVLKDEQEVQILLENSPFGGKAIGSDLNDFSEIKKMIKEHDKLGFCLDLSHAFAFGYDLNKKEDFIKTLEKSMEIRKIKLIHLSDSAYEMGSKMDQHKLPGEGFIGEKTLKNIVNHPKLKNIPIILELPKAKSEKFEKVLEKIHNW